MKFDTDNSRSGGGSRAARAARPHERGGASQRPSKVFARKNCTDVFSQCCRARAEVPLVRRQRRPAPLEQEGLARGQQPRQGVGCWFPVFTKTLLSGDLSLLWNEDPDWVPPKTGAPASCVHGLRRFGLQLQAGCTGKRRHAATSTPS